MPLEIGSQDDADTPRGRARVMLRMLREERERNVSMLERERDAIKSHVDHDCEIVKRQARFLGSYGAQLDTSKFNALTGAIHQIDVSMELLEEVIKSRRT